MFAYLNLCSQVTIGNVKLDNVSTAEINESILETSGTAKITLAKNFSKFRGKSILEQFKVGDPVEIQLGYNDKLKSEFTGFVTEIESDIPLIIHCEDAMYKLKQTNYTKAWISVTLKEVLTAIIPKTIKVECPHVPFGKFIIDNENAFVVLQRMQKDYGLYARLRDNVLNIEMAYVIGDGVKEAHEYIIGRNIKKNALKYKSKDDFKLRVKATGRKFKGKEKIDENGNHTETAEVIVGCKEKEAQEIHVRFNNITDKAQLKQIAESIYSKRAYDGYTGSITGFGFPRTRAGDAMVIKDTEYSDREGKYLIEKVTISYGENGFERKNDLTIKLS